MITNDAVSIFRVTGAQRKKNKVEYKTIFVVSDDAVSATSAACTRLKIHPGDVIETLRINELSQSVLIDI